LLHEGATVLSSDQGDLAIEPGLAAYVMDRQSRPVLHSVLPLFFRRRRGRFENLIQQHIANIQEVILEKLKEKELLNPNETLQQRIERFKAEHPLAAENLADRQIMQKVQNRREASGLNSGGFGQNGLGGGRNGGGRR
jgi:hypothetical protein